MMKKKNFMIYVITDSCNNGRVQQQYEQHQQKMR